MKIWFYEYATSFLCGIHCKEWGTIESFGISASCYTACRHLRMWDSNKAEKINNPPESKPQSNQGYIMAWKLQWLIAWNSFMDFWDGLVVLGRLLSCRYLPWCFWQGLCWWLLAVFFMTVSYVLLRWLPMHILALAMAFWWAVSNHEKI